jgi:16S rRNA G1207 methylase RsmC
MSGRRAPLDPQYLQGLHEDIRFDTELDGRRYRFHTTWGLFSPREIDAGSRLLVRHLDIEPDDDCLDIGCGYGPIGLHIAASAPQGQTIMVDKDFVAVDYARANAQRNGLGNCSAQLSNGFSSVHDRQFDLVVSNLPAKTGKEMLYLMLDDAQRQLRPGGRICVVTITGLRRFIQGAFQEFFGNYKKLKQGKDYTVALARKD